MNDRERDPVAWGHMQDAGRVPGIAAANDVPLFEDGIFAHPSMRKRQIAAYLEAKRKDWCPRTEDGLHHPQCGCDDGDAA